jgi:hypothetical protein
MTEIEDLYQKMQKITLELAEDSSILAVAGVMVAQALTIYKTALSEEEYEKICSTVYNSRSQIKKLERPVLQ